jgi:hypothetical protein
MKSTNLRIKLLLQIQKQWEDSTMLLAGNRQQHKDITKHRLTEREKQNLSESSVRKKNEQASLQEALHLEDSKQNHSENSKS